MESMDEITFTFEANPDRPFELLNNSEKNELWEKWGLRQSMQLLSFRFDHVYRRGMSTDLLNGLFSSEVFHKSFQLGDGRGGWCEVPRNLRPKKILYKTLSCNCTSLNLFDRLINDEIVRKKSGQLMRMQDVYLPCGITVADQLRGVFMLGEESEHYGIYTEEEQKEFLYHVMWRLVSGGALNQWEENFEVYRSFCKDMYKDCVNVTRNASTGDLEVTSTVLQVEAVYHTGEDGVENETLPLFPRGKENENSNFFYVIVNPSTREAVVWYNAFWSPF